MKGANQVVCNFVQFRPLAGRLGGRPTVLTLVKRGALGGTRIPNLLIRGSGPPRARQPLATSRALLPVDIL